MWRALVTGTGLLLVVLECTIGAQPRAMLTPGDIQDAIRLADSGAPAPYALRHAGRADNPVVVGAVYTPFVRVAILAKAALDAGRRLQPADVDPKWTAPLVYIAFRWYCCDGAKADEDARELARAEPQVVMLPVAERAPQFVPFTSHAPRGAITPVWSRSGTAMLEAFGATPPYDDIVLVAAFPLEALRARRPFAIYKQFSGGESIRIGVVRADDVAGWR